MKHYFGKWRAPRIEQWHCGVHLQVSEEAELPDHIAQKFADETAERVGREHAPRKTLSDVYAEFLAGTNSQEATDNTNTKG